MPSSFHVSRLLVGVFLCAMCLSLSGCVPPGSETSSDDGSAKSSLPYFSFHQPKEIKVAVERMRELHGAITSSDPLPEPIFYQVKEVIHGSGPGKHSHYFFHNPESAKDGAGDHDGEAVEDDGHVTTGEELHDVTIGPLTEMKDLMRWLPEIASNSDMPENDWVKFNRISKELTPQLREILKQSTDSQERRASYRKLSASVGSQISILEELVK